MKTMATQLHSTLSLLVDMSSTTCFHFVDLFKPLSVVPDLDAVNESRVTALSYVGPTAAFKAIDYIGNADVEPESAFTYNYWFNH